MKPKFAKLSDRFGNAANFYAVDADARVELESSTRLRRERTLNASTRALRLCFEHVKVWSGRPKPAVDPHTGRRGQARVLEARRQLHADVRLLQGRRGARPVLRRGRGEARDAHRALQVGRARRGARGAGGGSGELRQSRNRG